MVVDLFSISAAPDAVTHHANGNGNTPRSPSPLTYPDFQIRPATDGAVTIVGQPDKFAANVAAIEALAAIEAEDERVPTEDELLALARYSGWGPVPQAFDERNWKWRERAVRLRELLSDEDYEAARASTPNAMYTPPGVAREMWNAFERLGFHGGRILEPAAGNGIFIGTMPSDVFARSDVTAVEMDRLSARMCQALYPSVHVINSPLEKTEMPKGYYDVAISNVPFGAYEVFDPELSAKYPFLCSSIHNYFFAKALSLVRPGGLVAFITSRYTMDAKRERVRHYLNRHAELVGAVRLPFNAFYNFAHTEVTTDIIFLRKRDGIGGGCKSWVDTAEVEMPHLMNRDVTDIERINEYYINNPHMVVGEHALIEGGSHPGSNVVVSLREGERVKFMLPANLRNLPRNIYEETVRHCTQCGEEVPGDGDLCDDCLAERFNRVSVSSSIKEGSFFIYDEDGRIYQKSNGFGEAVTGARKTISRIAGMIKVRDALLLLVEKNLDRHVSDKQLRPYQAKLTLAYHTFIARYGFINNNANRSAFRDDPDAPLLFSIEDYDEETGKGSKTAIFSRRVIGLYDPPDSADSAASALSISLNETGRIDWDRMEALTGKTTNSLVYELGDAIFKVPGGKYVTRDEYLSGNVRRKLAAAESAARRNPDYERNVSALHKVVPADLTDDEIFVALGAPWIPVELVEQFANELVIGDSDVNNLDSPVPDYEYTCPRWGAIKISYIELHAEWVLSGSFYSAPFNTKRWGTKRYPADELLKTMLNSGVVEVKDRIEYGDGGHKYILNVDETFAAREKKDLLNKAFKRWLFLHPERRDRLVRLYNDKFNATVPRSYDGSHLTLPGMSVDSFKLHKHQLDAIWRSVQEPTTLLWHIVGAGKTAVMICAGMELKRLGLRRKVVHAIPNHMLDQYATDFQKLYPGARVLTVNSKQLNRYKRREMLSRIATGEYDAVVMTHDALARIQTSAALFESFVNAQIDELRDLEHEIKSGAEYQQYSSHERTTVKKLEAKIKKLRAKMEKRQASLQHDFDNPLSWEQLGIDCLFVDEFHLFKNLFVNTRMRLAGVSNSESGRAFDMFIKTQWLTRRCACGELYMNNESCYCSRDEHMPSTFVGATGTAVANTMGEVFTLLRYFDYQQLIDTGMLNFDAWAATFGEAVTMIEMKPSGKGYRQNTRFARFNNVPELLRMLYQFTDVQYDWRAMGLVRPEIEGGAVKVIAVEPSPELLAFVDECDARYENLSNVPPYEDNVLKVIGDATKAATDMRMITCDDEDDDPGSKINTAVDMLYERYLATTGVMINNVDHPVNLTQMVFLDAGVPGGKNYPLYDDIRKKLVARGVRKDEVAFIHEAKSDAAKLALFEKMNKGEVRILIGSTSKMGVGTNAQRLLKTLYHLDCPWRPADIEQRDGRGLRQGNLNKTVEVARLVTKKSFDVYRWQVVETKARFISQIMTATLTDRCVEDIDGAVISYAEAKAMASDDPLMRERVEVEGRLRMLTSLYVTWHDTVRQMRRELGRIPSKRERLSIRLDNVVAARERLVPILTQKFSMSVGFPGSRREYTSTADAGKALLHYINSMGKWEDLEDVAELFGCPIDLRKRERDVEAVFHLGQNLMRFATMGDSGAGNITRLINTIKALPREAEMIVGEISELDREEAQYRDELARTTFEQAGELEACQARLEQIEEEIEAIRQAEEKAKMEQATRSDEDENDEEPNDESVE